MKYNFAWRWFIFSGRASFMNFLAPPLDTEKKRKEKKFHSSFRRVGAEIKAEPAPDSEQFSDWTVGASEASEKYRKIKNGTKWFLKTQNYSEKLIQAATIWWNWPKVCGWDDGAQQQRIISRGDYNRSLILVELFNLACVISLEKKRWNLCKRKRK